MDTLPLDVATIIVLYIGTRNWVDFAMVCKLWHEIYKRAFERILHSLPTKHHTYHIDYNGLDTHMLSLCGKQLLEVLPIVWNRKNLRYKSSYWDELPQDQPALLCGRIAGESAITRKGCMMRSIKSFQIEKTTIGIRFCLLCEFYSTSHGVSDTLQMEIGTLAPYTEGCVRGWAFDGWVLIGKYEAYRIDISIDDSLFECNESFTDLDHGLANLQKEYSNAKVHLMASAHFHDTGAPAIFEEFHDMGNQNTMGLPFLKFNCTPQGRLIGEARIWNVREECTYEAYHDEFGQCLHNPISRCKKYDLCWEYSAYYHVVGWRHTARGTKYLEELTNIGCLKQLFPNVRDSDASIDILLTN